MVTLLVTILTSILISFNYQQSVLTRRSNPDPFTNPPLWLFIFAAITLLFSLGSLATRGRTEARSLRLALNCSSMVMFYMAKLHGEDMQTIMLQHLPLTVLSAIMMNEWIYGGTAEVGSVEDGESAATSKGQTQEDGVGSCEY